MHGMNCFQRKRQRQRMHREHLGSSGWFDKQGLENFSGLLHLKRTFEVPKELAGKSAILKMGTLVDSDRIFINGEKVGETGYCFPPRIYPVPEGLLKAGENESLSVWSVVMEKVVSLRINLVMYVLNQEKNQPSWNMGLSGACSQRTGSDTYLYYKTANRNVSGNGCTVYQHDRKRSAVVSGMNPMSVSGKL